MAEERVTLRVGGVEYEGWETVQVSRSIEAVAGSFFFSVSDRPGARTIRPGDACSVLIDGRPVITGYVDGREYRHEAGARSVTIRGRDATGQIVDCSAVHPGGEWTGRTLTQIAQDLCAPFGVSVRVETDIGAPFAKFGLQQGEKVFEALDRAAKMRGVLLLSDGLGSLVIARAGTHRSETAVVLGEKGNAKSVDAAFSVIDRYSEYIVKGQSAGTDFTEPEDNAARTATVRDEGVQRPRPLIVIAEGQGDLEALRRRALWERNVRIAQGSRIDAVVQGWTHPGGLWEPNVLVSFRDEWTGFEAELLVVSVDHGLAAEGRLTTLRLCPPEAFEVLASEPRGKRGERNPFLGLLSEEDAA